MFRPSPNASWSRLYDRVELFTGAPSSAPRSEFWRAPLRRWRQSHRLHRRRRREQSVGQGDLADPVHAAVFFKSGVEKEDDRQFRAFARAKPLIAEAEAGNLVEPSPGNLRRHIVNRVSDRLPVGFVLE